MVLLFSSFTFYGLSIFAVFFGLDFIATVPPTIRLTAQGFGRERAGMMFGWIFAAHQLGGAVAARRPGHLLAGLLHGAGLGCFVAALATLALRLPLPISRCSPPPEPITWPDRSSRPGAKRGQQPGGSTAS